MTIFRYKAYNESGKRISGVIDADARSGALARLKRQNLFVEKISPVEKKPVRLAPALLLSFTRELSQLLSAGLPLYESLQTIEEKYRRHKAHPLLLQFCDQLKNGESLSSIFNDYSKIFDPVYLAMVQIGEKSGALPWVFEKLYELIQKRSKLKRTLFSAMAYPLFLFFLAFAITLGLLLFVVPSMRELFEGRALHPLTVSVLAVSQFLQKNIQLIGLCTFSIIGGLWAARKKINQLFINRWMLKIPLLKELMIQAALVRFCRSASLLLDGGTPLMQTLPLARKAMNNPLLEKVIEEAEAQVIQGKPLSHPLKASSYIPPLVPRMLSIAEETGQMQKAMKNIADIYEEQLERSLSQLTAILQPALLLLLAVIVTLVILSVLLPLTDVGSMLT